MADTASSGGNVFTRHIGPLPMWGWTAIVGAVIIGYAWWKNRNSSSTSAESATTDASQVPQFVNQTYTNVQPPSAPAGPPPATGPYRPGGPNVNLAGQARPDLQKQLGTSSGAPAAPAQPGTPAKKPTGTVHKKAPKPKAPSRKGGPVKRG